MAEFNGSIAQSNVRFPIETVIETIAGAQYSRAMIFMHLSLAAENLSGVTNPTAGQKVELDSSSYATIASGGLKKWLVPFFSLAQASKLYVCLYDTDTTTETPVYSYTEYSETLEETDNPHEMGLYEKGEGDNYTLTEDTSPVAEKTYYERTQTGTETVTTPATAPLSQVYESYKYDSYFKFAYAALSDYVSVQTELGTLCLPDALYSAFWVGTSDTNVLSKSSALISALKNAGINARVIYNPDADINPALAQLGDSLATVNSTGTPVGNDTDYHAFAGIKASGALKDDKRVNLTATEKSALDEQRVGYDTYVGDGTENVATEGSYTLNGESVGANWVKHYIEYVCKVRTANYITQRNRFRTNAEYQAVLSILASVVNPFVDLGRLAEFAITAPPFSKLPKSADSFTVSDAWKATYIDRLRSVLIYGTLYITQATK